LPRPERIARTTYEILRNEITGMESDDLGDAQTNTICLRLRTHEDLLGLAEMLEPYARKDFAVRYGHLKDGQA
jgi:hypothetical protein